MQERAAAGSIQRLEVAHGLGEFQDAERIWLARESAGLRRLGGRR